MKILIQKNLLSFLLLPLFINFSMNVINGKDNLILFYFQNGHFLISLCLSFYFYYIFSEYLKISLNLESRILAITYFLTSFFLLEFIFFPLIDIFPIKTIYYAILIFWISLIIIKTKSYTSLIHLFGTYGVLVYFNNYYFEKLKYLENYTEWNSDVPLQWAKITNLISAEGLLYTYGHNPVRGQGLLLSTIQTVIFKINFPMQDFQFIRVNTSLLLFLTCLLFFDLKISRKNKYLISLVFILFVINSDWLSYLMTDSLMLDGLASLFFACFIYKSEDFVSKTFSINSSIFFIFFSTLFFSKQFLSTLSLIYIIYLFLFKRNLNTTFGLAVFGISGLYSKIYAPMGNSSSLQDQRSVFDLFFDLIYLRDIELTVINEIFYEFAKDRIALLILFFFLMSNLMPQVFKRNSIENKILLIVFMNTLFILILYVSWWQNVEVQSSYRYFFTCLHLIMISLAYKEGAKS